MNVESQNRVREIIEHLVRIAEGSPAEEASAVVAAEVRASGASNRDIALAFSALVNGLQEHLKNSNAADGVVLCSFCQKSHRDVKTMVQGPAATICNECIAICQETVSSRKGLLQKLFARKS